VSEPFTLPKLSDELLRAAAIAWIDGNFGLLSGKASGIERLIACFVGGMGTSWDQACEAFEAEWASRSAATPSPKEGERLREAGPVPFNTEDEAWQEAKRYSMDDHTLRFDELMGFLRDQGMIRPRAALSQENGA
jgi:hypothetical protein